MQAISFTTTIYKASWKKNSFLLIGPILKYKNFVHIRGCYSRLYYDLCSISLASSRGGGHTRQGCSLKKSLRSLSLVLLYRETPRVCVLAWLEGISVHDISGQITIAEISGLIYRVIVRSRSFVPRTNRWTFATIVIYDGMTNWFPLVRSSNWRPCHLARKPLLILDDVVPPLSPSREILAC